MSFQLPLPAASKVTFLFDGLFFFCFYEKGKDKGKSSTWGEGQVGILPGIPDHRLKLAIYNDPSKPPLLELTDRDHKLSRLLDTIIIKKNDAYGKRVMRNDAPIGNRKNRKVNPDSFKWAIDFETDPMHSNELIKDRNALRPRLIFKDGSFCTKRVNYCAQKLFKTYPPPKKEIACGIHVAAILGVDIDLNPTDSLFIELGGITIKLAEGAGSPTKTYFIDLRNNEDEEHPHAENRSDIHFFYDKFFRDGKGYIFDFEPVNPDCEPLPDDKRAIEPFVCYGITGGKTSKIE